MLNTGFRRFIFCLRACFWDENLFRMISSLWDYDLLPACFVHTQKHCRGHNYLPTLGAATESVVLPFKAEGYHLFDCHARFSALIFQNTFPLLGQVTSGSTTFVLLFGQHLLCWSRESTLVTVPHPPTSTCLHFALMRILSHDNTQRLGQHSPESRLNLEKIPLLTGRSKLQSTPILFPS